MITNPNWQKSKESKVKPYFHQISLYCIERLIECMESIDIEELDCDTCLIVQEILIDESEDEEFLGFAIENLYELLSYIATGNLNIRIETN